MDTTFRNVHNNCYIRSGTPLTVRVRVVTCDPWASRACAPAGRDVTIVHFESVVGRESRAQGVFLGTCLVKENGVCRLEPVSGPTVPSPHSCLRLAFPRWYFCPLRRSPPLYKPPSDFYNLPPPFYRPR
ncbi:hypothetical protein Bbelb_246940 [Branchiostoma belcheri]|nr:hypothetical protein Bbelb_246940 [Branchiostoma belcheri]